MLGRAPALLLAAALAGCGRAPAPPAACPADGYPASTARQAGCTPGPGWLAWAFIKAGANNSALFIGKPDGSCAQRITADDAFHGGPAFFPGGRQLVYSSTRSGTNQLHLLDLLTGAVTPLPTTYSFDSPPGAPEPLIAAAPSVSPDGSTIAFEGSLSTAPGWSDLFSVPAAGGDVRRVTTSPASTLPRWSPDGHLLHFLSWGAGGAELFSAAPDGSGVTQVTSGSGLSSKYDVTGDGRALVYARFSNTGPGSVPTELVAFELSTGTVRVISAGNEADPAVDAATGAVAVARRSPTGYDLYLLDFATGAVKQQLTSCPGQAFAASFAR